MHTLTRPALAASLVAALACGGSPSTPTAPRPTASIAAAASPTTWAIRACGGCGGLVGELETGGLVIVTETAGVSLTLGAMDVRALNAAGEVTNTSPRPSVGTRLVGGGRVELDVGYHFPPSAQAAAVRIVVTGRDDNGHDVSAVAITIPLTQ